MTAMSSHETNPWGLSIKREYPPTNLRPLGHIPAAAALPEMTVIIVKRPSTSSRGDSRTSAPADSYNPHQTLVEMERQLTKNSRVRVFTNNPWAVVNKDVRSKLNALNFSCSLPLGEKDFASHIGNATNTESPENVSSPSPRFLLATQSEADDWLKDESIIEMSEARRELPFEVQRMLSEDAIIAVGATEHGVQLFTNRHPTELDQTACSSLVQDLAHQYADDSEFTVDIEEGVRKSYFGDVADKISEIRSNAPYSILRVGDDICDAFLGGHCEEVRPLTKGSLGTALSHHQQSAEGMQTQDTKMVSGSRARLEKWRKGGARVGRFWSKLGSPSKD